MTSRVVSLRTYQVMSITWATRVIALTRVMQHVVITLPFSLYFVMSYWAYCLVEKRLPYKQPTQIKTCLRENGRNVISWHQILAQNYFHQWSGCLYIASYVETAWDFLCYSQLPSYYKRFWKGVEGRRHWGALPQVSNKIWETGVFWEKKAGRCRTSAAPWNMKKRKGDVKTDPSTSSEEDILLIKLPKNISGKKKKPNT